MYRKQWLDLLRAFGIILVVIGHNDVSNWLKLWIYSFHMPLFFYLSGYVDKSDRITGTTIQIKENIKKLLYPYFVIGSLAIVFNTICELVEEQAFSSKMLFKRIVALLYGNCIWENNYDYINTLWFLVALFCVKCIHVLVCKIRDQRIQNSIVVCITIAGCLWRMIYVFGIRLPLSFDVALLAYVFFYCGTKGTSESGFLKKTESVPASIIMFVTGTVIAFINCQVANIDRTDIFGMKIGNPFLFFAGAFLIIYSLKNIFMKAFRISVTNFVRTNLCRIGSLSLLIMALHLYIMKVIRYLCRSALSISVNGYLMAFIVISVTYLFSLVISRRFSWIYIYPLGKQTIK